MCSGRVLVQATVTAVISNRPVYPCCRQCYQKLLHDFHSSSWLCQACQIVHQSDNISWRYCLNLRIADNAAACNVSVFGKTLEPFFGVPAVKFNSIAVCLENDDSAEIVSNGLNETFLGHSFLFGFKSHVSTARLKKSTSSPITLAQILYGEKILKSKKSNQDRNNLIAVLMLCPYLTPFPTVAYNIYRSRSHLKPLNATSCESNSQGTEDVSVASQVSFIKSSTEDESSNSGTDSVSFSKYSFGQSTLQFSFEQPFSQAGKTSSTSSDISELKSSLHNCQSGECVSDHLPPSILAVDQEDTNHSGIQRTRSDVCQYLRTSSFKCQTSPVCFDRLPDKFTSASKSLLPQCPQIKSANLTVGCIQNGREMLRDHNINSFDSSALSRSSECEISERSIEKRSYKLSKLTEVNNAKKVSPKDNALKTENKFSFCDVIDNSCVLELLFDDNESWLQMKSPGTNSRIQKHSDMPDSEDLNEVLNNVFKDEMSFQYEHRKTDDRRKHCLPSQKNTDQCLQDKFTESSVEDLPESEDIDDFLKNTCSNSQSSQTVLSTAVKSCHPSQSSQVYNGKSSDKNTFGSGHSSDNYEIPICSSRLSQRHVVDLDTIDSCLRKVKHKPSQSKLSHSNKAVAKRTTSVIVGGEELHTVSADSEGDSSWQSEALKCIENMATISNKKSHVNTMDCVRKDCNIIINKAQFPKHEVKEHSRRKMKGLCKVLRERVIQKYSGKLSHTFCYNMNTHFKAEPMHVSHKYSGSPITLRSLDKSENRLSLVDTISDVERKTTMLELLKADCEMKRVEIILDLKCQSLQNSMKGMLEESDKTSISDTRPIIYCSTKESQSSVKNKFDDTSMSFSLHNSRNKKKQTYAKLDSYSTVDGSYAYRTRCRNVGNIKVQRQKSSTSTEPCSNDSLENGDYFNSHKAAIQQRAKRKLYQNLPVNVSRTDALDCNAVASTDHSTTDTSNFENVVGLRYGEECADLKEVSSVDRVTVLDTSSPKDFGEEYGSNFNTNGRINDKKDTGKCAAKQDMPLRGSISVPDTNSEPLFSDCDESVLKSDCLQLDCQKESMQDQLSVVNAHTQCHKASSSQYTLGTSNASVLSDCNGSIDLFDIPESCKNIGHNFASSSSPTKNFLKCLVDSCQKLLDTPSYRTDSIQHLEGDTSNLGNSNDGRCTSNKPVGFDNSEPIGESPVGDSDKKDIEYEKTPMSSKRRHVQFSRRLRRVSTVRSIDMQMQQTSSPMCNVQDVSSLKSCLKKSVADTSPNSEIPFSQDLFSPSPIFNNNSLKKRSGVSGKCGQLKAILSYEKNNPESVCPKRANQNNNCMLESSLRVDGHFIQYQNVDSPLLFSENKFVSLTPKRDAKSFLSMCENKAATPKSVNELDNFSFLLTPDLFSP